MSDITIPKKLAQIVEAFFAQSPRAAKKLITQAAKAIYGSEDDKDLLDFSTKPQHVITNEELEDICLFMQGIKPSDMLEAILAAQITVTHLLGMRRLAMGHPANQHIGLKMIRLSMDSMQQLQKKRCGGMQNVTVNYNYNNKGSLPVTVEPIEVLSHNQ